MSSGQNLIAGVVLFLVATVSFVWLQWSPAPISPVDESSGQKKPVSSPESGNTRAVSDVIQQDKPPAVAEGLAPLLLKPAENRGSPGEKGMSINLSGLEALGPGDTFSFHIPQEGSTYAAEVAEVRETALGNRIVSGSGATGHPFLFTIGPEMTFGSLQTPAGRYQLEVRDGFGRIVAAETVARDMDHTIPDYVIPRREEAPPLPRSVSEAQDN